MAFCTNCGQESDTAFCAHCGTAISATATNRETNDSQTDNATSQPAESEAKVGKSKLSPKKLALFIGIPVVVLIVIITVVLSTAKKNPFPEALSACDIVDDEAESYIYTADDGESLLMDGEGEETWGAPSSDIWCVLDELNVPESTVSKMENTSSMMGVVSDEWDGISAEWTYHPDDGFDLVLEYGK